MDPVDINTVIGVAIGYLVAALIRYLARTRFWGAVRSRAVEVLHDPAAPNDPREATAQALLEVQATKVNEVARSISSTIPPPGQQDGAA